MTLRFSQLLTNQEMVSPPQISYEFPYLIEKIIFSCKVTKYNRFGMKQERNLLLTNIYLSNLKKKGNATII